MANIGTTKKYYILYKVKRDTNNNITDIEYLKEYNNLTSIIREYNIHFNNIKSMINKSYNNDITTFKDYTIIQE